jgi:amino acid adenylation domain-containing protein/thioester reductase-like protein
MEMAMFSDRQGVLIHQLVELQVEKTPDAVAIVFQNQQLTYQELNQKANQLAHYLQTLGVKPEVLVGVCMERSLEMVIALLGILKAGGAYVPLDPTYPSDRLTFIAEETQLSVLLTLDHLQPSLPLSSVQSICLDTNWEKIAQYPTSNPAYEISRHNLAYVIYTSGSTGKPKGVLIEHEGAVNTLLDINQRFQVTSQDRVLAVCSLNFDLSVYDIFGLLIAGGRIVLPNPAIAPNPKHWLDLMEQQQITLWNSAPPVMQMLAGYAEPHCHFPPSLRLVLLSGDWIPLTLPALIRNLSTQIDIISLGGATEASIWSIFYNVEQIDPTWKSIPYGKPLANQQFFILDEQLQRVADGAIGELFIGGAGVARGYLNRPDLNATKFLPNPFSEQPNLIYRTGDIGRYLPDGNIEFLGRVDHQVKIRGFRVEIGEIEFLLTEHPAVTQAIVVVREDELGGKRLAAYIVPNATIQNLTQPITIRAIRNSLKQKLPDYMIPSAFVLLEELPLTLNGKIDRRALPVPKWSQAEEGNYVSPTTPTEIQLAQIWSQLLNTEQVGIHDNFFELGGHSLLSVQLLYQINESFQLEISLGHFLETPTIATLAQQIKMLQRGDIASDSAQVLEGDKTLDPTISPENTLTEPILNIFLTGATGFLGTFLLHELLQQTRSDIYCLVRATNLEEGRAKIQKTLQRAHLWHESLNARIFPVLGDLAKPHMGVEPTQFSRLAEKLDIIYHCGAWVNVVYPYSALEAVNVTGTQEVLRLASQTKVKPVHFISTTDVYSSMYSDGVSPASEHSPVGPINQLYSGYAQSKLAAEGLVMTAYKRGLPVSIYRPSAVTGHSQTGFCQFSDFIARMIQGCIQLQCAPQMEAYLNMVPVDYTSQSIVHIARHQKPSGQVYNITNPQGLSWEKLVLWVNQQGYPMKQVAYETWYAQLLKSVKQVPNQNELTPLTPLLTNQKFVQKSLGAFHITCDNTLNGLSNSSIVCPLANEALLDTYFSYFNQAAFLKTSPPNNTLPLLQTQ